MDVIEPVTLNALAQLVWPMCRISAFLASMFTLSSRSIPTLCKALIAISISVCILPSIPDLKQDANPFSLYGFMVTIKEVLIGLALGYATLFISQCFILAGQTIAMQTGLGFASLVDPVSGTNTPVVGQFFTVLCTLVFFSVNGHLIFFRLIMESFTSLPMGNFIPRMSLYDLLFFTAIMFNAGLTMALSAICTMLVVNFTLGVMTKAAPQLNVFSLGFAITMIVGIFVLLLSLNAFMGNFTANFNDIFNHACSLVRLDCDGIL
jgi:flagellar biosynthetic protein FliR